MLMRISKLDRYTPSAPSVKLQRLLFSNKTMGKYVYFFRENFTVVERKKHQQQTKSFFFFLLFIKTIFLELLKLFFQENSFPQYFTRVFGCCYYEGEEMLSSSRVPRLLLIEQERSGVFISILAIYLSMDCLDCQVELLVMIARG